MQRLDVSARNVKKPPLSAMGSSEILTISLEISSGSFVGPFTAEAYMLSS
jgi:hypothetical protein